MSGDDEDRLDFGEDEELEDQISLGDAEETAREQQGSQQRAQDEDMGAEQESNGASYAQTVQQNLEGTDSEEPPLPPGWVTRVSRQGELYYFHEATTESQWDRPTLSSVVTIETVDIVSSDAKSTPAAPAASTSQDIPRTASSAVNNTIEAPATSTWGRNTQPRQEHAFTSRRAETENRDAPKSARDVATAAAGKQSATSSSESRAPARVIINSITTSATGRASPTIPTGPRTAKALPTGPRADQQESPRWPARDVQSKQSVPSSLPTGPAADRNRVRDGPPSGRPYDRDLHGPPPAPRHARGDAGWPTREPVGPPADLARASSSGFRGPAHARELPPPPAGRKYDREVDDDRPYPRVERGYREPDVGPSYRDAPLPSRGPRGPPRDARDDGPPRRVAYDEYPVEDRAPRRRELSPLPARRELPPLERRPRSPLPSRPLRDYPEPPYRGPPREYPEERLPRQVRRSPSPPPVRRRRSPSPIPARRRRSPSPPPMRKWAVRALTPPPAEAAPDSTLPETTKRPHAEEPAAPSQAHAIERELSSQPVAPREEQAASRPEPKPATAAEESLVFPRPREKRVISPGLASRLDQPLSQPPVRDLRKRAGRIPPPLSSRPDRRSPSPDPYRKRPAQGNSSLADRMGDGRRPISLLSRMGDGEDRNDDRPTKRSKTYEMDVDTSVDLARRVSGQRSRSRSPPTGRGITIFGASRSNGQELNGRSDEAARFPPNERVTFPHSNGVKDGVSLIRIADSDTRPASRTRERSPRPDDDGARDQPESSQRSTISNNSSGLPARPAGFASLPPRPSTIIPPPDMRRPARGGSSTPVPPLLDTYRPGPPDRRHSSRGPPPDPYYASAPKEPPVLDRYVPRRAPPPGRPSRPRSPPPSRDFPRRDYR